MRRQGDRREPSRPHARKSNLSRLLLLPAIISPREPRTCVHGKKSEGQWLTQKGSGMQDTVDLDAILSKRSELFGQPCRGTGESPRSSSGEGRPLPGPLEERPHPHRDSNRLSQVCATTQVPVTPTQRGPQGISPEDNLGAETHDDLHTVTGPQPWKGKVMKWGNRSWRLRAGQSGIRTVVLNPGEGLRSSVSPFLKWRK